MADENATDAETSLSGARLALVVLAATWLMAYLDRAIIALLATSIKHSFQVSDVHGWGWLILTRVRSTTFSARRSR